MNTPTLQINNQHKRKQTLPERMFATTGASQARSPITMGATQRFAAVMFVFILFALGVCFLHPFTLDSANAESKDIDVSVTLDPTISISTNVNSVSMNVTPNNLGSVVTSDTVTVNVGTNNPSGYTLSIASSNTNPALLKDGTSTTYTIPTLSSPTTSTTWASDNNLNNRWGFTHNNTDLLPTDTYLGVPASTTSGTTIKSTTSPANTSETSITFATKIDETQPAGSYENTVVLSAVANNEPNTWMQDFTSTQCNLLRLVTVLV